MLNTKVAFPFVVGCFVILGTWLVGCGGGVSGPPTEPVSGVVTLDGQPVAKANVVFVPDGAGQGAAGVTDEAGKYALTTTTSRDGAVVGSYKIMVTKVTADGPGAGIDLSGLSSEERDKAAAKAFYSSAAVKSVGNQKKGASASSEIPTKYNNIAGSGLKADVVKGPNTIDLPLTSGK
jgi:hypothetical protein